MANDKNCVILSELAYLDLKEPKYRDYDNLSQIFYDDEDKIKTFSDPKLQEFANKLDKFPDFYKKTLENYSLIDTADEGGYQAIAVKKVDSDEVVIANRGTAGAQDLLDDAYMSSGKLTQQFDSSIEFYEKVKANTASTDINLTGHSVGGSLATYQMVNAYGDGCLKGVKTFEEYGLKSGYFSEDFQTRRDSYENAWPGIKTAYGIDEDFVFNGAEHIGTVINPLDANGIYTRESILETGFNVNPDHLLSSYLLYEYDDETGEIKEGQINQEYAKKYIDNIINGSGFANDLFYIPDPLTAKNILDTLSDVTFRAKTLSALTPSELEKMESVRDIFNLAQNSSVAPPRRDPISVDLDNDGIETVSSENGVYFDLDASGTAEKTGWIAPDDGLIVMDRNDNGTIDNGQELFGDATVLQNGEIAETGFEALAEQDTNEDGIIDSSDENFDKIKVWQDTNQDGVSQVDELRSLDEAGIRKIHLDYLNVNIDDGQGNIQTRTAGFEFTDGRDGLASEFLFDRDTVDTGTTDFSDIPEDILSLPYLRGFGDVTDLYHAMNEDAELKTRDKTVSYARM